MPQANVESFERFVDAFNRHDVEAIVEVVDPAVEWRPAAPVALGGEATVYRGHEGPFGAVIEFDDAKATQIRSYLDLHEALEAAGLEG